MRAVCSPGHVIEPGNGTDHGARVVAPWILPLRVVVFAILSAQARLLSRSLITLVAVGHPRKHAIALA